MRVCCVFYIISFSVCILNQFYTYGCLALAAKLNANTNTHINICCYIYFFHYVELSFLLYIIESFSCLNLVSIFFFCLIFSSSCGYSLFPSLFYTHTYTHTYSMQYDFVGFMFVCVRFFRLLFWCVRIRILSAVKCNIFILSHLPVE